MSGRPPSSRGKRCNAQKRSASPTPTDVRPSGSAPPNGASARTPGSSATLLVRSASAPQTAQMGWSSRSRNTPARSTAAEWDAAPQPKAYPPEAPDLAVRAHVRHRWTRSHEHLMRGWDRDDAREAVRSDAEEVLLPLARRVGSSQVRPQAGRPRRDWPLQPREPLPAARAPRCRSAGGGESQAPSGAPGRRGQSRLWSRRASRKRTQSSTVTSERRRTPPRASSVLASR